MDTTERLFIGLLLDALFKDEIIPVVERLRGLYPDHKWVRLRYFHLTIHFLGDTNPLQKEKVSIIAKQIAASTRPFKIALEGMGAFPSLNKPRVIWIGASEASQKNLANLYNAVTRPLVAEGFPVEHEKFTPHATLFRVRAESPIAWDSEVFQFPKTEEKTIDRLFLFKSILSPQGSEYQPVEEFLFKNGYTG